MCVTEESRALRLSSNKNDNRETAPLRNTSDSAWPRLVCRSHLQSKPDVVRQVNYGEHRGGPQLLCSLLSLPSGRRGFDLERNLPALTLWRLNYQQILLHFQRCSLPDSQGFVTVFIVTSCSPRTRPPLQHAPVAPSGGAAQVPSTSPVIHPDNYFFPTSTIKKKKKSPRFPSDQASWLYHLLLPANCLVTIHTIDLSIFSFVFLSIRTLTLLKFHLDELSNDTSGFLKFLMSDELPSPLILLSC